jgi:hypothetical protein
MKRFRVILISLVVLFSIIMIFSMLIPANTRVSRAINIKTHRDSLKQALLDIKQWVKWHPNLKNFSDSNPVTYSADGEKNWLKYNGFTMQVTPAGDTAIDVDMTNREGKKLHSAIKLVNLNRDTCVVNWYAQFHSSWYPWEKFRSMFFDQLYGPSLDSNLLKLKQYAEK